MRRFALTPGGAGIVFTEGALAKFAAYRQLSLDAKEAGGQLFARFEGAETIIVEATGPNWLDRRSRCSFEPNAFLQRREIACRYRKGLHFIGDWHTHAEPLPDPSGFDLGSMKRSFQRSEHELKNFVMVIVGNQANKVHLSVSLHDAKGFVRLSEA